MAVLRDTFNTQHGREEIIMATKNTDKAAIANLKETLKLVTAERDEWRRLSGEWQKRAEALRDDMVTINRKATEIQKTVKTLQGMMKS
jgi:hypothetical protein